MSVAEIFLSSKDLQVPVLKRPCMQRKISSPLRFRYRQVSLWFISLRKTENNNIYFDMPSTHAYLQLHGCADINFNQNSVLPRFPYVMR
jgi:hypothetical protein